VVKKRLMLILLAIGVAACVTRPNQPPTIRLESPQDGVEVSQGERVLVQSSAQDEMGVVKIELWVDGRLYEVHRSAEPSGDLAFDAIQIWDASELGLHTLTVKALSADGRVSEPVSAEVNVVQRKPTPTPAPDLTPTASVDDSCVPSARFVEDVTVPDDSLFYGGVNFTKTWRLRNDGECTWPAGTTWVFISGNLLGAQSPVEVELAQVDRIVDISVDMIAPPSPGTYSSYWRLQLPDGEFFGDQAYVRIIVP
jgi:hypothetical protein